MLILRTKPRRGRRLTRRSRRGPVVLIATTCLIATAPLAFGANGVSRPITLSRTVQLSAVATGYAIVSLSQAVQASGQFPRLVRDWKGGASAVVLAPDRPDVFNPTNPPSALVVPNLPGRIVNPHPYIFIGLDPRHHDPAFFHHWLPTGRYRLYLVTNGPGEVTLQLPGLKPGMSRVDAAIPGYAHTEGQHQQASVGSLPPTNSYGATGRFTSGRSLVWNVQWMHVPVRVADAAGGCFYAGQPPTPAIYEVPSCAFAQPTPNAEPDISAEYVGYIPPPDYLTETEGYGYPRGPIGNQTYVAAAGPVQSEGAELLWLSW